MARIILGVTGSVAAVRTPALYAELLQAGHTVGSAAAEIGADVDVPDFVTSLIELGFVSPTPAPRAENGVARPMHRAARRIRPGLVRPLFGRVAWTLYAGCAALVVAIFATQPGLVPRSGDIFFLPSPLVSVACVTLLTFLLACIHEVCHWAAARAEGPCRRAAAHGPSASRSARRSKFCRPCP